MTKLQNFASYYEPMKELLTYIVSHIVSHPEEVEITEETTADGYTTFYLKVNPEDMGIVIGKGGNIIRAIRDVLRVKAIKENKRFNLELLENKSTAVDSEFTPPPRV